MAELFSPSYLPDPRTFVPQQRIDHFRRQRQSLEQHQQKSNEELARLEELFAQRKRAIQRDSEAYNDVLKKVCGERTRVDKNRCQELTEQYKQQLLGAWEQYQEKQAAIQAKLEADRKANPVLAELITSKSPAQDDEFEQRTEEFDRMNEEKNQNCEKKIQGEKEIQPQNEREDEQKEIENIAEDKAEQQIKEKQEEESEMESDHVE